MKAGAATAGLVILLAGCGSPSPDLFDVERSGRDKNANVRMVVSDGGDVRCNGAPPVPIGAKRLLDARQLSRDLSPQAALAIELPPEKNSTLRYRVRLQSGTLAFSDTSRGRPKTFDRVVAFTADVVENVCKLER